MQPVLAFVDEYGDPSLEVHKEGVTEHFVVTAVMVEPKQLAQLSGATDQIRRRHFQTGEMKSNSVGMNWTRRLRILGDLASLDFKAHVLLVDKAQILKESGLRYKRSFLKYIHGLLYSRLYRAVPDLVVIADEHGSREFMEGFRRYVHSRHILDLFNEEADIHFENSKAQPLIQLADIVTGSIGHAAVRGSGAIDAVLKVLAGRILTFAEWPPVGRPIPAPSTRPDLEIDALIRRHSFNLANDFISKNAGQEEENERCQIETLRYLYFHSEFISDLEYVSTTELRAHLDEALGIELTVHAFRSRVIGPLRDAGVLLASGSQGYKLPISSADIRSFIAHGASIIGPLWGRLKKARDEIATVTNGRLDLFDGEGLEFLKARTGATDAQPLPDNHG